MKAGNKNEVSRAAPFVKWVGGKRSIMKELVSKLPDTFNIYWEPFVGGGALYFEIHGRLTSAVLSDSNHDLILAYNIVKQDPLALITRLEGHFREHSKIHYYKVRSQHDLQDPLEIVARFIYLNKTCFNGVYRVNKKGEFNTPMDPVRPMIIQPENIILASAALEIAQIEHMEFDNIKPAAGDFVYCDPPYYSVNDIKYTKEGFGETKQRQLHDFVVQLHKQDVKVMISNSDTPLIYELYEGLPWCITTIQASRRVRVRKSESRGSLKELIITNYSPRSLIC